MAARMPLHSCSARCRARCRFKTSRFGSAPCHLLEGAGSYRAILYRVSPRPLIACGAAPASFPGSQCASAAFHRAPSCLPNPIDPKSSGYLFAAAFDAVYTRVFTTTHTNGTGRFNLAQGLVGTASGVGASLSTALFGVIAASFGRTVVFLSIAATAFVAVLILWFLMPETRPSTKPVGFSKIEHMLIPVLPSRL